MQLVQAACDYLERITLDRDWDEFLADMNMAMNFQVT
jgi:hypothetical protein